MANTALEIVSNTQNFLILFIVEVKISKCKNLRIRQCRVLEISLF